MAHIRHPGGFVSFTSGFLWQNSTEKWFVIMIMTPTVCGAGKLRGQG
jgi:hypothetical protein